MRILLIGTDVEALQELLREDGYDVAVAATARQAMTLARSSPPSLAIITADPDDSAAILAMMQQLSLLAVPSVLLRAGQGLAASTRYRKLARMLARLSRKPARDGNGHRH